MNDMSMAEKMRRAYVADAEADIASEIATFRSGLAFDETTVFPKMIIRALALILAEIRLMRYNMPGND